jgi:PAS domain S-box-containing protein
LDVLRIIQPGIPADEVGMTLADPREPIVFNTGLWKQSWPVRYGFAVLAVAVATALQFAFTLIAPFHQAFILLYPTVVVVAIAAGFGPAILATALSATSGGFFFLEPRNSFVVRSPEDLVAPLLFAVIGILLTFITCSRTRAERALQQEQERFRLAQEAGQIGVFDADYTTGESRWSPQMHKLYGLAPGDFEGTVEAFLRRVHPADKERMLSLMAQARKSGKGHGEWRIVRPDGSVRWISGRWDVLADASGPARAIGTNLDITERREMEDALSASEDRYRDLVENSEDLVCTHDLQGNLLSVNAPPARILGYTVEELLKIPMRDLIVPAGRELFEEYLERLRTTGQPEKGLLLVTSKSGELRTWEFHNTLRTEGVPRPIVRGLARDITEQRQAELALRNSEQRYRILFERNVAGVGIATGEGRVLDCNDAFARILGYENADQVRGRTTSEFYFDQNERTPLVEQLRRAGELSGGEMRLRRKDGSPVCVVFNTEVFESDDGSVLMQATLIDITARKNAETALRASEERFRLALKDSPITVFSQDRDLRYTWIYNPRLYWRDEILGKSDAEIMGAGPSERLDEIKRRVLQSGLALREEVQILHNERHFAFDLTIDPLFDAEGGIIGVTGAAMDIARLRELADGLQAAKDKLTEEKSYFQNEVETELGFEEIIGQSTALRDVLKQARVVASTESTVLLLGETGTGKELVARAVHSLSSRQGKNFIKLNCAAVPTGLLESELFGHEKGAFTGAVTQKVGRLELADKGTLFLDEVGELPLELQPKLLRVLQDREFERLGGVRTIRVDVRLISATNRDLPRDVAEKRFREDLFYRLNVFPIQLPPLRERRPDIPVLVQHFVRKYGVRMSKHIETIPAQTMNILQNWNWPGNVRELENMIERMVILTRDSVLADPPVELVGPVEVEPDNLTEVEREHIIRVLRETNGILSGADGAAVRLGVKRTTLQSMLKRFGIEVQDFRRGNGTLGRE